MLVRYVCDSCRLVLTEESLGLSQPEVADDIVVLSTLCPDCRGALEKEGKELSL